MIPDVTDLLSTSAFALPDTAISSALASRSRPPKLSAKAWRSSLQASMPAITPKAAVERLQADGIGCGVYYPKVVFDYDCFAGHPGIHTADLPVARRLAGEVLSLPVHPALTDAELDRIVEGVRDAVSA